MDELRRAYHDRIAELRDETIAVVSAAAAMVGNVSVALLDRDLAAAARIDSDARKAKAAVPAVETEVVDLLAQQAPMARDLRVILASLRIAQIGDLCLGLAITLARRVGRGDDVLTPSMRALVSEIGVGTASLLRHANEAWIVVDETLAVEVVAEVDHYRTLQRRFLAELIGLRNVPVEIAVDLGMTARAYERLTDHAVEIAGRVAFAATGVALVSADG